jgi:AcrR family transcriptional regulator
MSRLADNTEQATLLGEKPYHHGDLRRTLLESAVARIEAVGSSQLSLRDISRTVGVSHGAPAHHFGDKIGLFTAIADEGFRLLASKTTPLVDRPDALLQIGVAYVEFAVERRGYFEVMFRPDYYRTDDESLVESRARSFEVLYQAVRRGAGVPDDVDVTGLAVAAWSVVHGFATLWLAGNFQDDLPADLDVATGIVADGIATLGRIIGWQLPERQVFEEG